MARLIQPDGTETVVTPKNGKSFSLEELQGFVGGWTEHVYLGPCEQPHMIIHEEGKLERLSFNRSASKIAHDAHAIFDDDDIVGPALICDNKEFN